MYNTCVKAYDVICKVLVKDCIKCNKQIVHSATFYRFKSRIREGLRAQGLSPGEGNYCLKCYDKMRYYKLDKNGEPRGRVEARNRRNAKRGDRPRWQR